MRLRRINSLSPSSSLTLSRRGFLITLTLYTVKISVYTYTEWEHRNEPRRQPTHKRRAQSFNRICQVAPMCMLCIYYTIYFWPSPFTVPNGSSIGSAVFAQADVAFVLHCAAPFPWPTQSCPIPYGGAGLRLIGVHQLITRPTAPNGNSVDTIIL